MRYHLNMSSREIRLDWEKLRTAVCYIIQRADPDELGAVKLHKVLYYTDMLAYLETGLPVTGSPYRKRPFGPTCDPLLAVIDELERERLISVSEVNYHGYAKKKFASTSDIPTNVLSADEKKLLDDMIDFVCRNHTAKTISDFSHDMVWQMVDFGEVIPYHNALHLIPNEVSADAMAWAKMEIEALDSYRSEPSKLQMASRDVRALRASLAKMHGHRSI